MYSTNVIPHPELLFGCAEHGYPFLGEVERADVAKTAFPVHEHGIGAVQEQLPQKAPDQAPAKFGLLGQHRPDD